jgi:zinc-dependent metalloproteinase lipoprotein
MREYSKKKGRAGINNVRIIFFFSLISAACLLFSACTNHHNNPSTFTVRMETVDEYPMTEDEQYPYTHVPYLIMENMSDDEYVISRGAYYSHTNRSPNAKDYCEFMDGYDTFELFRNWDWSDPLIWSAATLTELIPHKTYYVRGVVETNKATYVTNVLTLQSEQAKILAADPDAYEIPVIFHIFPSEENLHYEERVADWLAYANMVYSNYYDLPHLADTKIRFVPAKQTPDGTPLKTPGLRYYTEEVYVDNWNLSGEINLDKHYWDAENALNVWVCPFINTETSDVSFVAGFTRFPFFDAGEMLPGMNSEEMFAKDELKGIYINASLPKYRMDTFSVFAHEAGHFLGLDHVFTEDYCGDTLFYDREAYTSDKDYMETLWFYREIPDQAESYFISDNIMDYNYSYALGITPDQNERLQHTLTYAYFIPGDAGKTALQSRGASLPLSRKRRAIP